MTDLPLVNEDQLLAVFRALARHEVAYAVFGGIALGLHGLARATRDLDLFVPADASNVERLKAALRDLFDDPSIDEISAEDLCGDYPAVRYVPPAADPLVDEAGHRQAGGPNGCRAAGRAVRLRRRVTCRSRNSARSKTCARCGATRTTRRICGTLR